MNKMNLIEATTKVLSTRQEAKNAVETVFQSMRTALRQGEKVVIHGFGSFHLVIRRSKKARNILKNETVIIPARRRVKFKASKDLLPKN